MDGPCKTLSISLELIQELKQYCSAEIKNQGKVNTLAHQFDRPCQNKKEKTKQLVLILHTRTQNSSLLKQEVGRQHCTSVLL